MILLAIDPGPAQSAWVILDATKAPSSFGIWQNEELLDPLRALLFNEPPGAFDVVDRVVIEKIASYGMAVGAEVFETVFWSGRFAEAAHPVPVDRVTRMAVRMHLCGSSRAKDPNIRQALIDRFGGSAAIGTTKARGPLYGVAKDVWSALAVAVTYADGASS